MDSTPSFGVSMISKVPSNPQLTLVEKGVFFYDRTLEYLGGRTDIGY